MVKIPASLYIATVFRTLTADHSFFLLVMGVSGKTNPVVVEKITDRQDAFAIIASRIAFRANAKNIMAKNKRFLFISNIKFI